MITLAIDPGKRNPGVALFDGDELRAAKCVAGGRGDGAFQCAVASACAIVAWVAQYVRCPGVIVCEWPQVYERERKKDPNNLLPLAGVNTAVGAIYTALAGGRDAPNLVSYKPREWKGTLDGDAFLERILSRLTDDEKARIEKRGKTLDHNAIDAIGVGLKHLGRLERKRVYAR
jgi:hypothetical protein